MRKKGRAYRVLDYNERMICEFVLCNQESGQSRVTELNCAMSRCKLTTAWNTHKRRHQISGLRAGTVACLLPWKGSVGLIIQCLCFFADSSCRVHNPFWYKTVFLFEAFCPWLHSVQCTNIQFRTIASKPTRPDPCALSRSLACPLGCTFSATHTHTIWTKLLPHELFTCICVAGRVHFRFLAAALRTTLAPKTGPFPVHFSPKRCCRVFVENLLKVGLEHKQRTNTDECFSRFKTKSNQ